MGNLTPYNLIVLVAVVVIILSGSVIYILRDLATAAAYAAFISPVLIALVGWLVGAQNAQNHAENQARISEIEQKVGQ